jgi:hypothetical protein
MAALMCTVSRQDQSAVERKAMLAILRNLAAIK